MFQIEQINLSSWLYFLEILICIMEEDMQFVKLDVFFNFICIMEEDMQSTKFSQTADALLQKAKARANAGPP